jgi:hypothetical protein
MNDTQIIIEQKAKVITDRFSELSSHAEGLAFPDYRAATFKSKDLSGQNIVLKYIYYLGHPYGTSEKVDLVFPLVWVIYLFLLFQAYFVGLNLLIPVISHQIFLFNPFALESLLTMIFGFLGGIAGSIVTYAWWVDIARKNINNWIKLIPLIFLSLILYSIIKPIVYQNPFINWNNLTSNFPFFLAILILLLIPSVTFFIAIVCESILFLLVLIRTTSDWIVSIHAPRPVETINKLAFDEIVPSKLDNPKWRLCNLNLKDITVLHNWSEANRDSSEKRTIPTLLFATILVLPFSSDIIRQMIDKLFFILLTNSSVFINAGSQTKFPDGSNITSLLILFFIVYIVIKFLNVLLALSRNIVVQNLIIEACILVENSIEEPSKPKKAKKKGK